MIGDLTKITNKRVLAELGELRAINAAFDGQIRGLQALHNLYHQRLWACVKKATHLPTDDTTRPFLLGTGPDGALFVYEGSPGSSPATNGELLQQAIAKAAAKPTQRGPRSKRRV